MFADEKRDLDLLFEQKKMLVVQDIDTLYNNYLSLRKQNSELQRKNDQLLEQNNKLHRNTNVLVKETVPGLKTQIKQLQTDCKKLQTECKQRQADSVYWEQRYTATYHSKTMRVGKVLVFPLWAIKKTLKKIKNK